MRRNIVNLLESAKTHYPTHNENVAHRYLQATLLRRVRDKDYSITYFCQKICRVSNRQAVFQAVPLKAKLPKVWHPSRQPSYMLQPP